MVLSEDILKIKYRKEPFDVFEIEKGTLLTPSAKQFLNEKGIEQLRNTKILFEKKEEKPDIVFSSDLKRCSQSMEILEIDEKIEKIFLKEFRETRIYDSSRWKYPNF